MAGQVVHTIKKSNGAVTGIAVLNDRLYVCYGNVQEIAVYCPTSFQRQQNLHFICQKCRCQTDTLQCSRCVQQRHGGFVFGSPSPFGGSQLFGSPSSQPRSMVGCAANNCLYFSGNNTSCIHKAAIGENNTLSSWSTCGNPQGLSMTSSQNLLVTLTDVNALHEYSTDGHLIRQIRFANDLRRSASISNPVHAAQLSNDDHYAVVHHGPKHQFSIVSSDGQLVQSYRGDAGHMNEPSGIAVDQAGTGRAFVADRNNNRILVINCKTLSAYPLPLPTDCRLSGPYSIHYDSVNSRLYIGEWNGGRIICCKM